MSGFPAILPLLLLYGSCTGTVSPQGPRKPHVVFVVADDMGYNDIGYHNSEVKSPFIDSLAAEGVRLENYYVQPMCSPTRQQLMTGRLQIHTGHQHGNLMIKQPSCMPADSPSLPEKLRQSGYETHAIGKWHLGFYKKSCLPTRRGFQTFFGTYTGHVNNHFTYRKCTRLRRRRACGTDLHDDTHDTFQGVTLPRNRGQAYSSTLFAKKAEDIIVSHDESKPLFLFLSFLGIHLPFQAPGSYIQQNSNITNSKRRTHMAMVTAIDDGVKRLVDALKDKGIWNDTILVFTSDNGGLNYNGGRTNYPLKGYKASMFEGGVKAVGFVNSPLLHTTGYTNNQLMHVSDWYPTLINLAGGDLNGTRDVLGFDQWPVISGNTTGQRSEVLHNIDPLKRVGGPPQYSNTFDTRIYASLRVGDFKIHTGLKGKRGRRNQVRLYNIRNDPSETTDLSRQNRTQVLSMLDNLQSYQQGAAEVFNPPNSAESPIQSNKIWGPWVEE